MGVSVSPDAIPQDDELAGITAELLAEGHALNVVEHFSKLWLAGHYSRAWRFLRRPKCGALKADGTVCIQRPEAGKKRCRWHGGMNTGPKTPEGRKRVLEALARGRETIRRNREARRLADIFS